MGTEPDILISPFNPFPETGIPPHFLIFNRRRTHVNKHHPAPSCNPGVTKLLYSRNEINVKDYAKYRKIFCGT